MNFAESVRTRVAEAIKRRLQIKRIWRRKSARERREQQRQHGELHFARFDLLAEIFRRATDHEPGDENGDDGEQKNGVESVPPPPGAMQPISRLTIGTRPLIGMSESKVHWPRRFRSPCRDREQGGARLTEAQILAFQIPADRIDAKLRQQRISSGFGLVERGHAYEEDDGHHREQAVTLPTIAHHAAEGEQQSDGDNELAPRLDHIRQGARIFERMRRIGVEKAAAVVAEQFDGLWLATDRSRSFALPLPTSLLPLPLARLGRAQKHKSQRH